MGFWDVIVDTWKDASEAVDHPKLSRGSVLRIELTRLGILGFDHYGIYAGKKQVIHFSEGKIRKESLKKFIEGAGVFNGGFVEEMSFLSFATKNITLEESYQRAKSCIGMEGYDVLEANCEHFALWCRTGEAFSGQAFGNKSDRFEFPTAAFAVNIPRKIGETFNKFGMKVNREIKISGIVDV